ncbi:hypothetical protein BDZ94DRAFT_1316251 [Collybia nuda]|uniref:Uncharacterized protein n=1 Tax=Collybia nuda TaxID=64659 RepID=A0A9P5XTH6_9AGAR|nr:hypothetical protein BDZ94DRAFT_1316251 [Collybia nuda]
MNSRGMKTWIHPYLDGTPCDEDGYDLPTGSLHLPQNPKCDQNDFTPYTSRAEFELADLLFRRVQMSRKDTDDLMEIMAAIIQKHCETPEDTDLGPPFSSAKDMYNIIDSTELGDVPWEAFSVRYNGEMPDSAVPTWMTSAHEVWYCDPLRVMENQIGNPDFQHDMDFAPKQVFNKHNKCQYSDFMSGNWAWEQADIIAKDPETHGAMFAPIIMGSDKTTVSVATGQNDFYPLYASVGNVQNHIRRAHRNALSIIGFLAIPKTDKQHQDSVEFRKFRRQLFHSSIAQILMSVRPWMTKPRITQCGDGQYRRIVYGLGSYIVDYPEQALLA